VYKKSTLLYAQLERYWNSYSTHRKKGWTVREKEKKQNGEMGNRQTREQSLEVSTNDRGERRRGIMFHDEE